MAVEPRRSCRRHGEPAWAVPVPDRPHRLQASAAHTAEARNLLQSMPSLRILPRSV